MARNRFGGSAAEWFVAVRRDGTFQRPTGLPTVTFWSGTPADLGRVMYDDLRALDDPDTPVNSVTGLADGTMPEFDGPDDDTVTRMWASTDGGVTGTWITTTSLPSRSQGERADTALQPDENGKLPEANVPDRLSEGELSATFVRGKAYSVNDYGADPAATWETNRDAFQAANDAAAAAGGGRVVADPGVYECKGIVQDSHVWFDLPGVTLSHPDGSTGDIITSRLITQNAAVFDGTLNRVSVLDSSAFEVGQIVGVRYAGVVNPTQNTTLTGAVDATQTTGITLTGTTGFPASGVMLVDSELIAYTGISAGSLTGVTRGAHGSTAAAHSAGAIIGLCLGHLSTVKQIVSGTTLELDTACARPVSGSSIYAGAVAPKITGVRLAVNRVADSLAWSYGVSWPMVRWGEMHSVRVENGDGGVILDQGASDCTITDLSLHNCGLPEIEGGSAFWLFRSCKRNKITGLTVTGAAWVAAYIDDRTTTGTEWDGPNDDNIVTDTRVNIDQPGTGTAAIYIVGGNRNYINGGYVKGSLVGTGLSVSQGAQGITHDGSKAPAVGNEFASFRLVNCRVPWNLSAPGNVLHDVTHEGAVGNPMNDGGNFVYASKMTTTAAGPSLGGRLEKKVFLDFPSIPAGSTAEMDVTVTGAVVGDLATAHPNSMPPAGLMWTAVVTAANTVKVRMANVTAAAIDPANTTWRVSVMGGTT